MSYYGKVNMKTGKVTVNPSKNKNGIEMCDTIVHEYAHLQNPNMSEKGIINKAKVGRVALLSLI